MIGIKVYSSYSKVLQFIKQLQCNDYPPIVSYFGQDRPQSFDHTKGKSSVGDTHLLSPLVLCSKFVSIEYFLDVLNLSLTDI